LLKLIRDENRLATTLMRNASSGACFALIPAGELKNQGGMAMKAEVLDKVTEVSAAAAQFGAEVGRVKDAVIDVFEDGINAARSAVKKGRRLAEDLADDAEYRVKRHPLNALGVTFGIGLGLGTVIGVLLARNGNCGK
jgi:ElaB/YqjD/DUF883 family membrane-anchored ribosome-binding protein